MSSLLRLYSVPERLPEHLPVLKMLLRDNTEIHTAATSLQPVLATLFAGMAEVSIDDCESEIGSGALPNRGLPSTAITIRPLLTKTKQANALNFIATAFRQLPIPVIGRIHKGAFQLDLRCLDDIEAFAAQLSELQIST
jgi:L-seryl-tRNA(Ser) seleniumtransferase